MVTQNGHIHIVSNAGKYRFCISFMCHLHAALEHLFEGRVFEHILRVYILIKVCIDTDVRTPVESSRKTFSKITDIGRQQHVLSG